MKKYCIDCNKKLTGHDNPKRCRSCSHKGKLCHMFGRHLTGKDAPNYKHGKTHNNKCLDCERHITYKSIRCNSCTRKKLFKDGTINRNGKNNGMFGRIAHTKGTYYKSIFMRSSWEVAYAKYLDKNNIKWLYEPKAFDLGNTTYRPDFYLPESDTYIEIKGYWRKKALQKFNLFKIYYPQEKIIILQEKDLKELNIL